MKGNYKGKTTKLRATPDVLTDDDRARLLATLKGNSILQLRKAAAIRLMINAGLRSAEVCALRLKHLDFQTGRLIVKNGLGGRDRVLWVSEEDLNLIMKIVKAGQDPDSLVFQTSTGKPLDTRFLRAIVAAVGRKAGIERQLNCGLLRHTFATDLLRRSKNLQIVQEALGHQYLFNTQIYTHIIDEELEEAMKNLRKRE